MNTPLYYGSVGIFGADHLRRRNGVRTRFAAVFSRFQRLGRGGRALRARTRRELVHLDDRLLDDVGLARVDTL